LTTGLVFVTTAFSVKIGMVEFEFLEVGEFFSLELLNLA
jgi:hypothetical protein